MKIQVYLRLEQLRVEVVQKPILKEMPTPVLSRVNGLNNDNQIKLNFTIYQSQN